MGDSIPMKLRHERSKMMRNLSYKKRHKFYENNLGNEEIVLFENDLEEGMMHGFTRNYIRVAAKYDPLRVNETIPVILKNINKNGVVEVEEIIQKIAI
jgi:threonylcarbamoyladenosine tRNA methylthiotransferase MtaB